VSAVATTREAARVIREEAPTPKGQRRWTRFILPAYTWLVIAYLISPIVVMIVFGFNNPAGRFNVKWEGFTVNWYRELFAIPGLAPALLLSLRVAAISTLISTAIGAFLGLALGRYRFRGIGFANFVIFLAIASPEIVLGSSLLVMFVNTKFPLGFWSILVAHVMFSISFVAITVRARVQGLDRSLEEAAQDLGADPITTFVKVTLPLIFPGVLAGALLAFALSIDDFVITQFVSGATVTFPLWVYGSTRIGTPPQVNVMGTLLFAGGVLLALSNVIVPQLKARLIRARSS